MFGMPVLWNAVATSPQGMVTAVPRPRPKSITRVFRTRAARGVSTPSAAHEAAAVDVLDHGRGGAAREPARRLEAEGEVGGGGQAPLEVRGQAVGRHHVEAAAGQQHHARRARASASRAAQASNTSISPVMSR